MKSYKNLYRLSFDGKEDALHFAAHSHHPWPDCTFEAHKQYWLDSARNLDAKWNTIFGEVLPTAQKNIAQILNLSNPEMIAIAPNTHEFVVRLFSCFEKKIKILTTDSEFHSFGRQLRRSIEANQVEATIVPVEPYETLEKRWSAEASKNFDMIFTSQVFFNSGLSMPALETWVPDVPTETVIVVDGYHAFCAVPTDLKSFEDRIYYIAGGYKYAQSGEGVCFMAIPKYSQLRPVNTGWFASFETLNQSPSEKIQYSNSGMRFSGSTYDSSGCYRLNSVMETLRNEKLGVKEIHERVSVLKEYFIEKLGDSIDELHPQNIIRSFGKLPESHFVTFKTSKAKEIEEMLAQNKIMVDSRGDRLRFGFGLYHDLKDIDFLVKKLSQIFKKEISGSGYKQSAKDEAEL